MQIQIVNPINHPSWDTEIQNIEGASFFHTAAWAKVLTESYGYAPTYFTAFQDNQIIGVIPIMHISSFLTGRRGVSLPFTDECSPIGYATDCFSKMWERTIKYGLKKKWKYIELRSEHIGYSSEPAYKSFFVHHLDLRGPIDNLMSRFRSSTKRNIKKAIDSGVEIVSSCSMDSVDTFYKLNCLTRKRHGLPPQPVSFFKNFYKYIIAKENGYVSQAIYKDQVVASAIFIKFGSELIYKYGASNLEFQQLRANNLIMWEAINSAFKNNFKIFNFGRTEMSNLGLLQFKRGWGASEKMQKYYRYLFSTNSFCENTFSLKSSYRGVDLLPIPLLKLIGNILYRHVG